MPSSVTSAEEPVPTPVRRETESRRSPISVTSVALCRVASWLGRGRRARRREREEAARRARSTSSGQASRQLALEMLTEVRGLIAAHNAETSSDPYRAASLTGSADGTTAAMYGSSATSTGSVSGAAAGPTNVNSTPSLAPPPVHVPIYEDRSRTSVGSWSSTSTASAAASGGSALTASAVRAARARRRVSMDLDVDGHVVMSSRQSSRLELSTPHSHQQPRRARPAASSRSSDRQLDARIRNSSLSVRPLPPLRSGDGDSDSSEEERMDHSAEERRQLLNSIVELLNLGTHMRDSFSDANGGGERRGGVPHLLRRFPTFPVEKGQVVAGVASCPICLDALSDTVMLLPCLCSGHESCMKTALSFDNRCPLHRLDIRKYVQEEDLETASMEASVETASAGPPNHILTSQSS